MRLRGPQAEKFESVQIILNGQRVDSSDWVVGSRTPSTQWPLHTHRFTAMFGSDDGLRHGTNRLEVTAWRSVCAYDRQTLRTSVPRDVPVAGAGDGARVPVERAVQLDGSETIAAAQRPTTKRPHNQRAERKHAQRTMSWEVVRRPAGSAVELEGGSGAQARLTPDVHGTYRVRLSASSGTGGSAQTTTDEVTIEAKPAVPPIGVPVTTITENGGITVGDTTYPARDGGWAQLLTLDRKTLEVIDNQTIGQASGVTIDDLRNLDDEITQGNDLTILSGGGRSAGFDLDAVTSGLLDVALESAGVPSGVDPSPTVLDEGRWSVVGVAGVGGSAHSNLHGTIYGASAGQGSQPGALTGYLREDTYHHYGFASAEHTTLDTNVPGTPEGVNEIQIGARSYTSDQLPAGYSGFHVLVLDSMLNEVDERTYGIDGVGDEPVDTEATDKMRLFLDSLDTPGYLVIVQSIGTPFGWQTSWVNDGPLTRAAFGTDANEEVPRAPSTWYDAAGTGQSLAGELGQMAGATVHDQLAELNGDQGLTLVASTGQVVGYDGDPTQSSPPVPVDSASAPVVQVGEPGTADRIVATLTRDRQSLWQVGPVATDDIFGTAQVQDILYQAPTAWPLTDAAHQAANCYLASQLFGDTGITDVRVAYYELATSDWDTEHTDLQGTELGAGATCPSTGQAVTEAAFDTMKSQLLDEMAMVSGVTNVTNQWTRLFHGTSELAAYVDLQTIAHDIIDRIDSIDDSDQSAVRTEKIVADSLKIAGSAFSLVPGGGVPFGVAGNTLDLVADTSADGTGAPSLGPLEAEVSVLGQDLVSRYQDIGGNISQVQAMLVSDYGKLQAANAQHEAWLPDADDITYTMEVGAKREFYSALLPTVYGLYYVDPTYIMDDDSATAPWDLRCQSEDFSGAPTHPFGESDTTPDAWTTPVISTDVGPTRQHMYLGIATRADIADDGTMEHNPHQPSLANMAPSGSGSSDDLFAALDDGDLASLGMDPTTLFSDARFTTRWFWCAEQS